MIDPEIEERDREIVLQFVTESGVISRMIRWFTWSDFSHVDAVTPEGDLLGAHVSGGVKVRPAGYARFTCVVRMHVHVSEREERDFWAFMAAQVGKKYDWRAIADFWLHGRDPYEDSRWFCSELCAAALRCMGLTLFNELMEIRRIVPGLLAAIPIYSRVDWLVGRP